jgi:ABC-type antimicrobial peptide transport system permease subunit
VSARIAVPTAIVDVAATDAANVLPRRRPGSRAWRSLSRNPVALASLVFLVVHLTAFLGPLVFTMSPEEIFPLPKFSPPDGVHVLGIDESGRDVFARCDQTDSAGTRCQAVMTSSEVTTTPKWSAMLRNVASCFAWSYAAEQSSTNVT